MIDISDGLSVDLRHIGEESGTGAEIEPDRIPLSPAMRALGGKRSLDFALHGGEDFQLLFTVRPTKKNEAGLAVLKCRFQLTRIGRITAGRTIVAVDGRGRRTRIPARGYEHFGKS
jgi:thiamine-monophosphate kinase